MSLLLFSLYAEYIISNAGLDEAQAGIKVARRKESERVSLNFNIQKTKIMASDPITSWQIDRETIERVRDFISLGSKITAVW